MLKHVIDEEWVLTLDAVKIYTSYLGVSFPFFLWLYSLLTRTYVYWYFNPVI